MSKPDGITVYLSSTKNIVGLNEEDILKKGDIPVCLVIMRIDQLAKRIDKKLIKRNCYNLSRVVHVDTEKRYIFIGGDLKEIESSLVDYDANSVPPECSDQFFIRWKETLILLLEFNIYDKKDKYILTLKGLWNGLESLWSSLKFEKYRTIQALKLKNETIITKE